MNSMNTFSREDTKLVKGFAIILMLYHHLFAFPNRIQDGSSYIPVLEFSGIDSAMLFGLFGKICVALFLFLGGYGTWMSYQSKKSTLICADANSASFSLSEFTMNKIKGLYAPYLKVFAIVVPLSIALGDPHIKTSISTIFWNATGLNISYNGEWWFFTDYLILLLTFPIMVRYFSRKHATFTVDLLAICIWNAVVIWLIPSINQADWATDFTKSVLWDKLYQTMQWSACFLMGCLFARWDLLSEAKAKFAGSAPAALLSFLCLAFLVALRYKLDVGMRYDFLWAPIICLCFAILFATKPGMIVRMPFESVGKHSTNIWLTHSFFCYHWCQSIIYLPKWSPLVFLLLLGVSYLFSLLINWSWGFALTWLHRINKDSCSD